MSNSADLLTNQENLYSLTLSDTEEVILLKKYVIIQHI